MSFQNDPFADGSHFSVAAITEGRFLFCQTGGGYHGRSDPDGLIYFYWTRGVPVVRDQAGGGDLTSGPAVVGDHVFARGKDTNIWYSRLGSNTWDRLKPGELTSAPAACMFDGTLHVFARGREPDWQMWHTFRAGDHWIDWQREAIPVLPGGMRSAPSLAVTGSRIDVVAQGPDRAVWHLTYDGSWSPEWYSLGGAVKGRPSCCWQGAETLHVFARGDDDQVWHQYFDWTDPDGLGRWHGWVNDAPAHPRGGIGFAPVALASSTGPVVDVFAKSSGAEVSNVHWDGARWQSWQEVHVDSVPY